MNEYVIKKQNKREYLVGIKKENDNFVSFYSNDIEDAFKYDSYHDASTILTFLIGLESEDLEIITIPTENKEA